MMLRVAPAAPAVRALFCARRLLFHDPRRRATQLGKESEMEVWIQPRNAAARLDPATLARVDRWRAGQFDPPSRDEAVRILVLAGLDSVGSVRLSEGDRVVARLLGRLIEGREPAS